MIWLTLIAVVAALATVARIYSLVKHDEIIMTQWMENRDATTHR